MDLYQRLSDREKEEINQLSREDAKRFYMAEHIKGDFAALVYILGYRDLGEFHHKEIEALGRIRYVTDESYRKLWLWSRGFFKTSIITISHSIYLILNNPDIRILLDSYTISIAEDILRSIKNQFIGNEYFRKFFPEFCPEPNSVGKIEFGTSQEFTVPCRTNLTNKEPTMMCAGIGTNLAGLHFDWHKHDDLVTKFSVTNDTQIQESKDHYYSLRSLFDNPGCPREDITGTIYHFNDLYCDFRKSGQFRESFNPVDFDGEPVFPERLNQIQMDELLLAVGPYEYQTQYKLNPVNPKDAKFKVEWLKEYEELPLGLAEYICVDPASTMKKRSDYTVIERWGVSHDGKNYLIEGVRDKMTAFQRIDALFAMVKKSKKLKWVTYEVIGGRHGDLEVIHQKQSADKVFFHIKETKASSISKVDRIEQRLVPQYYRGNIFLPKSSYFRSVYDGKLYDFVELLRIEYLQFPFTEHDDILDCQAQMFEEQMVRGEKFVHIKNTEGKTADDWDRTYAFIDNTFKKYPGHDRQEVKKFMFMNRMKRLIKARTV